MTDRNFENDSIDRTAEEIRAQKIDDATPGESQTRYGTDSDSPAKVSVL